MAECRLILLGDLWHAATWLLGFFSYSFWLFFCRRLEGNDEHCEEFWIWRLLWPNRECLCISKVLKYLLVLYYFSFNRIFGVRRHMIIESLSFMLFKLILHNAVYLD